MNTIIKKIGLTVAALAIAVSTVALSQPAPASAATSCATGQLSWGSYGTCVGYLQRLLNAEGAFLGYDGYKVLSVDKDFGKLTYAQVLAFQKHDIFLVNDGVVGKNTWTALCQTAYNMKRYRPDLSVSRTAYDAGYDAGCSARVSGYNMFN